MLTLPLEFASFRRAVGSALVLAAWLTVPAFAGNSSEPQFRLVRSAEPGWPQWRGPYRDAVSRETGLLPQWPPEGPSLIWSADGLGFGYSAPIIVGQRVYLAGDREGHLVIFALDLAGKVVWRQTNGAAWKTPYPGARASCTYSEGRLYHLNAHGRLVCLQAETGHEIWAREILEEFGARNVTWAISECVLVDEDRVFVTPGGSRALVAALDKRTGQTLWTTPGLRVDGPTKARVSAGGHFEQAGYGSPILIAHGDRKVLVNSSQSHVFGVDATTGELLWTHHLPTRYWVIAATPVLADDCIFVTAPDTDATRLLRLRWEEKSLRAEPAWKTDFDNGHGGVVRVGNELFGGWYRKKGWAGVDLKTGLARQRIDGLGSGSVLLADGRLYCLSQDGEMALIEPGEDAYLERGRFRLVRERKSDVWTHPVILDGRLYLRYHDRLGCYDVGDKQR